MLAISIFLIGLIQVLSLVFFLTCGNIHFKCSTAIRYGASFTLFQLLQPADFKCLLAYGQVPVIRVHAGGKVDPNGLTNIENARSGQFPHSHPICGQ